MAMGPPESVLCADAILKLVVQAKRVGPICAEVEVDLTTAVGDIAVGRAKNAAARRRRRRAGCCICPRDSFVRYAATQTAGFPGRNANSDDGAGTAPGSSFVFVYIMEAPTARRAISREMIEKSSSGRRVDCTLNHAPPSHGCATCPFLGPFSSLYSALTSSSSARGKYLI